MFEHTVLALTSLSCPEWRSFFGTAKPSLNVTVALLLHDIGKPLTLETPAIHGVDRIRTNRHDVVGAELVPQICERLRLASYADLEAGQVDVAAVKWLVRQHLILVHGNPDKLKPGTLYRYFLEDPVRGQELRQVIFADSHATRAPSGRDLTTSLRRLQERLQELTAQIGQRFRPLLTGHDIMAHLELAPGPQVGRLAEQLTEAQLEGRIATRAEALAELNRLTGKT